VPALTLEQRIERLAYALGFDLAGFVRLGLAETAGHFDDWLARGCEGEMHYLARDPALRHDTRRPHPGAVSAIVVGMDYGGHEPTGPVARYARGDDYHDLMKDRLRQLHAWLSTTVGAEVPGRAYVDTAPILERDLARRAGLGWFGKNTTLINPRRGSYFFIGSLFVAIELEPSAPFDSDRCGSCTRCLDACPTEAFDDTRAGCAKCISYLTIGLPRASPSCGRESANGCTGAMCAGSVPMERGSGESCRRTRRFPRPIFVDTDARTLARQLLTMAPDDYAAAFGDRRSAPSSGCSSATPPPCSRMWGPTRSAGAVRLRDHDHAVVREQVRAAIAQIVQRGGEVRPPSAGHPT
jgi:epoxyqueuosine reductase